MDEEQQILDKIHRVNADLTNLGMLPSEISGRDQGAFFKAALRTPISQWPGMYPHETNMGMMNIGITDMER